MAIQQSINQLLWSAQIGAGFLSNTPAIKAKIEEKNLSKQYYKEQKKVAELEHSGDEDVASLEYLLDAQKDLAKTTFELTKRGATYGGLSYPEVNESFYAQKGVEETKARIAETIKQQEQTEAFRKMVLEGTPSEWRIE